MSWFRWQRPPRAWEPQERYNGLSAVDFNTLATYNAERGRGIVHTPQREAEMAELQQRFSTFERERNFRQMSDAAGPALPGIVAAYADAQLASAYIDLYMFPHIEWARLVIAEAERRGGLVCATCGKPVPSDGHSEHYGVAFGSEYAISGEGGQP